MRQQPGDNIEQGSLAAAARSHNRNELTVLDGEVDVRKSNHFTIELLPSVTLVEMLDLQLCHRRFPVLQQLGAAGRSDAGIAVEESATIVLCLGMRREKRPGRQVSRVAELPGIRTRKAFEIHR
jgi:hypothetical protein